VQLGVPGGVGRAAGTVDGVEKAVAVQLAFATIDGQGAAGTSVDGSMEGVAALTMIEGQLNLGQMSMNVSQDTAAERGWTVGQQVELGRPTGGTITVTVQGVYENSQLFGPWIISNDAYDALIPELVQRTAVVLVKNNPGASMDAVRSGLEQATERFVIVQVQDREQYKETQSAQINLLLALLYALLALAVIIAILGIVNTLALSVVERRREIGMLRAVGMQRPQVRRTIYLESMLIAIFGAVVGVVLGLGFGIAFVRTLADEGLDVITVPWGQVAFMLVSSGVVGVIAALWPAIRAARTKPLEAISDL
jgi:putative ABC transport system permease protein